MKLLQIERMLATICKSAKDRTVVGADLPKCSPVKLIHHESRMRVDYVGASRKTMMTVSSRLLHCLVEIQDPSRYFHFTISGITCHAGRTVIHKLSYYPDITVVISQILRSRLRLVCTGKPR